MRLFKNFHLSGQLKNTGKSYTYILILKTLLLLTHTSMGRVGKIYLCVEVG